MNKPVKLSEIIDELEMVSDEINFYVNIKTGEIVTVTDDDIRIAEQDEPLDEYPQWQKEAINIALEVLYSDDFIALPNKVDINEYSIMEKFCLSIKDERKRDKIYSSLKEKGAFRRFKDMIDKYDVSDEWYEYKECAFKEIAIDWCRKNKIQYV